MLLKLNGDSRKVISLHGYAIDPAKEYVIELGKEMAEQDIIGTLHDVVGAPPAVSDYFTWLVTNGFDPENPQPTNASVSACYGKCPLWTSALSQGFVVKSTSDDNYYIVMDCSRLNGAYKYMQIILTPEGCC